MSKSLKQLYNEALKCVNSGRKALGLKALKRLPKGVVADAENCIIAECFSAYDISITDETMKLSNIDGKLATHLALALNTHIESLDGYEAVIATPRIVKQFINKFDGGSYPELERFVDLKRFVDTNI